MTMFPHGNPDRHTRRALLPVLVVLLVAAVSGVLVAGEDTGDATVFSEVCWSELSFKASKLLLSASTDLRVETIPRAAAERRLRSAPRGTEVPLDSAVVEQITMTSDLPFGRNELVEVLLDPSTGAALQTDKEVSGSKQYWKLRRYAEEGYFQWRAEPKSSEKKLERGKWTRRSKGLVPWDHTPSPPVVITDSYALIYLISAARLDLEEGRSLQAVIFSKGRLVEIELVARELITRKIEFDEVRGDKRQTRSGKLRLRRVTGTGKLLAGDTKAKAKDSDVDLGFLGMQGDLEVLLECGTGIPVEINGKAKTIGNISVSLRKVRLKS